MFRRCVHIGLCKMFVQYFLFFIITLLPDVPPEFSLMQTKIQHVCLSNVYLNGVERGVIFPNVKKQQSLETLLFSKLLFPRFPSTCRIVNYRKQRRNTPFYQTFISSPRRIFTFVWTKKLKLSQFNHKFLNFHIIWNYRRINLSKTTEFPFIFSLIAKFSFLKRTSLKLHLYVYIYIYIHIWTHAKRYRPRYSLSGNVSRGTNREISVHGSISRDHVLSPVAIVWHFLPRYRSRKLGTLHAIISIQFINIANPSNGLAESFPTELGALV